MTSSDDHIERVRAQFTRQAEAYSQMSQTRDEAALRTLAALSGAAPGQRALDVACGPGLLTLELARRCAHARGIDATDALLARARRQAAALGIDNVEFTRGEADRLELPDQSVNLATCRAAFHHFLQPARVLAEMKRVVIPGGRLLIADLLGSEDPETARYHDRIERLCDPTHVRALPASELEALFRAAGLETRARHDGRLSYDVEEWLAHGGPDPEHAAEIRALLRACLDTDRSGLEVRLEADRLRMRHRTAVFVLEVPPA